MKRLLCLVTYPLLLNIVACLPASEKADEAPAPKTQPTQTYTNPYSVPATQPVATVPLAVASAAPSMISGCETSQTADTCPLNDPAIKVLIQLCRDNNGGDGCVSAAKIEEFKKRSAEGHRSDCDPMWVTARDGLRLRAEPNTTSTIKDWAPYATAIKTVSKTQDWVKVTFNSQEGFMARDYLTCAEIKPAAVSTTPTTPTTTTSTTPVTQPVAPVSTDPNATGLCSYFDDSVLDEVHGGFQDCRTLEGTKSRDSYPGSTLYNCRRNWVLALVTCACHVKIAKSVPHVTQSVCQSKFRGTWKAN